MYINYLSNRTDLGYKCSKDIECGITLVFITDLLTTKSKQIIFFIIFLSFNNAEVVIAKDSSWQVDGFKPPISRPRNNGPNYFSNRLAKKPVLLEMEEEIQVEMKIAYQIELQKPHLRS